MPSYSTKLKLGRKLDGVDTSVASDNQISALFRFDEETGEDGHVSLSIESDAMSVDDVVAVFQLLHDRGVLTASQCKTWLHQSKASREALGETTEWNGVDLQQKVSMLSKGLKVRSAGTSAGNGGAAAKMALLKLAEVEKKIGELKATLRQPDGASNAEDEAPQAPGPQQAGEGETEEEGSDLQPPNLL